MDDEDGRRPGDEPEDEPAGGSGRQMIAVLVLLATLVGVGWWLTSSLRGTAAIQDCVMAGRSNCVPAR